MEVAKSLKLWGTVPESSARSMSDRVTWAPEEARVLTPTKSSTMVLPSSTMGVEVFLEILVSQLV